MSGFRLGRFLRGWRSEIYRRDKPVRLPEHAGTRPYAEHRQADESAQNIDIERPWAPPPARQWGMAVEAADGWLSSDEIDELIWAAGEEPRPAPEHGMRQWDEYDDRIAEWERALEEQHEREEDEVAAYAEKAESERVDDDADGL